MPFEKGKVGNPGGRPKSREITECLRSLLGRYVQEMSNGKIAEEDRRGLLKFPKGAKITARQELARNILNDAIRGVGNNRELVLDRIEGKVPLPVQGSDDPEAPPIRTQDETIKELARATAFLLTAGAPEKK